MMGEPKPAPLASTPWWTAKTSSTVGLDGSRWAPAPKTFHPKGNESRNLHVDTSVPDVLVGRPLSSASTVSMCDASPIEPPGYSSVDDDGDIVMSDMDNDALIKEVTDLIEKERQHKAFVQSTSKSRLLTGNRVALPSWLFVVDTNFILSHLKVLDDLLNAHEKFKHVLLIPWAVVQELDGLKSRQLVHEVDADVGDDGRRLDVGMLARRANRWAYEKFASVSAGLWGQTKEEILDSTATKGDDAILDCCLYFQEKQNLKTLLLSNDKNLCIKALIHHVKTLSVCTADGHMSADRITRFLFQDDADQGKISGFQKPGIPDATRDARPQAKNSPRSGTGGRGRPQPTYLPSTVDKTPSAPSTVDDMAHSGQPMELESPVEEAANDRPKASTVKKHNPDEFSGAHSSKRGLAQSRWAPGADTRTAAPARRRFDATGIAKPKTEHTTPSRTSRFTQHDVDHTAPPGLDEKKILLKEFLDTAERELIENVPHLLHLYAIDKYGHDDDVLDIPAAEELRSLQAMEQLISQRWPSLHSKVLPRECSAMFEDSGLYRDWALWYGWATNTHPWRKPKEAALKDWIESWDLLWKRVLFARSQAVVNARVVSRWREMLSAIHLE